MQAAPVAIYRDHARFEAADPDELVLASLACPYCLEVAAIEWGFVGSASPPAVTCFCRDCQSDWYVSLTPEQALRLGLMDAFDPLTP